MPKSERTQLVEKARALLRVDDRFVDVQMQFRVWERNDKDTAVPGALLPGVYGGKYDQLLRKYVGPADNTTEISCHEGQVPVLTFDDPAVMRLLSLGAPGAGKTYVIIRRALRNALERANSIGGLIGPTNDRRMILWREFIELVEPLGWIKSIQQTKKEIILVNNSVIQVLAAAKPSVSRGNPLQGRSWDWVCVDESQNVDDDSHVEIATRGRRAGTNYRIYETATNAQVPAFRIRLEQLKESKQAKIVRFTGHQNPWIEKGWWDRLKGDMSDREYREKILVEDVPPEMLVYHSFSYKENVVMRPTGLVDMTQQITADRYGKPYQFIVGQDFGVLVNASIILKAYAGKDGSIVWWAIDEITSYQAATAEVHAAMLLQRYNPDDLIIVADPHFNTKEADKSDYHQFRKAGLTITPAAHGKISRKHRFSMVNALLKDGDGNRRLFIDCDYNKKPRCQKLAEAMMLQQYDEYGNSNPKKNKHDPSHWPDSVGYGVFPWERIRGQGKIQRF